MPDRPRRGRLAPMWRAAFLFYALALFAATHWPADELPEIVTSLSDKAQHFVAYAIWTWLLLMTGWVPGRDATRRALTAACAGVIWGAVDELTQGIPAINRYPSWLDWLSDAAGAVGGAAVWRWRARNR